MQAMTPTPLERRCCDTKLDLLLVRSDCIAVNGVSVRTMLLRHSITTGLCVLVERRKLGSTWHLNNRAYLLCLKFCEKGMDLGPLFVFKKTLSAHVDDMFRGHHQSVQ